MEVTTESLGVNSWYSITCYPWFPDPHPLLPVQLPCRPVHINLYSPWLLDVVSPRGYYLYRSR